MRGFTIIWGGVHIAKCFLNRYWPNFTNLPQGGKCNKLIIIVIIMSLQNQRWYDVKCLMHRYDWLWDGKGCGPPISAEFE